MRFSDYVCDKCEEMFEYVKTNDLESFPEKAECPKCKSDKKTRRVFSVGSIDIAEGKFGNGKNGYNGNVVNHPSKYGSYKGTRI